MFAPTERLVQRAPGQAFAVAAHLEPEILIVDEVLAVGDAQFQAKCLGKMQDVARSGARTVLFVSHNLAVVNYIADRIMVMCKGRIVELAQTQQLFRNPLHPYTKALLAAVPEPRLENKLDLAALMAGRASDPAAWPEPFTIDQDRRPELIEAEAGHFVRASIGERKAA